MTKMTPTQQRIRLDNELGDLIASRVELIAALEELLNATPLPLRNKRQVAAFNHASDLLAAFTPVLRKRTR